MKYIWKYFISLNSKRTGTGYGPLPLQYSDILAYFELNKIDYDPVEIEILDILDNVAMEHYNNEIQKEQRNATAKVKK